MTSSLERKEGGKLTSENREMQENMAAASTIYDYIWQKIWAKLSFRAQELGRGEDNPSKCLSERRGG